MMMIKSTFVAQVFRYPVAVKELGCGANVTNFVRNVGVCGRGGASETKEQSESN